MVAWSTRFAGAVLLAGVLVVVPARPATAQQRPTPLECGVTPTADAVLLRDLVCSTGFTIDPGLSVDIDLNGHTLEVRNDCTVVVSNCRAIANADSLHDGHVVGWVSDIGAIERVHVEGDVEMGAFWGGDRPYSLRRSVVDGFVRMWRPDPVVDANVIRGNVYLSDTHVGVRNATVTRNWILEGGIVAVPIPIDDPWELSGDFSRNLIIGSPGPGIDLGSVLQNIGPTTIVGNIIVHSADDGIAIGRNPFPHWSGHPPATVRVEGNLAIGNAGHGINNAVPADSPQLTVVDGGRNRAFGNATPPACVGITCNRWH